MKTAAITPLNQQTRLQDYNDLNALQSIKHSAKGEARIDAVAQQFESLFVSMMIKSMRDANQVFAEGNMLQSNQTDMYQDMFDSQLAVTLSAGRGIGLADVIKSQLSKDTGKGGASPDAEQNGNFSLADYQRKAFPVRISREDIDHTVERVNSAVNAKEASAASQQQATDIRSLPESFETPEQFIDALYPMASRIEAETGIDARLMLAQSALETGWGKYQISRADGQPSYNMFGIKANPQWQGETAEIVTTEYRDGIPMKERAAFRAYPSFEESFRDYARFLQSNERYQDALAHRDNPEAFAHALQDSGYATDPRYGSKITRILNTYMASDTASRAGDAANPVQVR